jgi:flagella basal body P-ring formation protein FlgA
MWRAWRRAARYTQDRRYHALSWRRQATVGIEAHAGAAFLKYEVRAEASGRVGDSIQVRNLESGKTFRARVVRKGWVAVE